MKRATACIGVMLMVASPALAQVKSSDITIKSGDEEIKAFVAMPEGKGPFPAIVVIQEWWGLNDWIKENAQRLAGKGYVAIAPDQIDHDGARRNLFLTAIGSSRSTTRRASSAGGKPIARLS